MDRRDHWSNWGICIVVSSAEPTLVAQISSSYTPPPPERFVSPMTWGVENNVNRTIFHSSPNGQDA
jgi:hypothetical protein